ncbi:helix-turn-helix domain-containing protein [Pelagibacterium xiamenense]|uniref:helix-turn-helix domain-containing protein n=1 Tax=Pelagibacterium xiamenense TaxID=2901140 RepID=UPI001E4C833A|nr:XRE family transcriptional regulator [Pelagibacterium xiamenense]
MGQQKAAAADTHSQPKVGALIRALRKKQHLTLQQLGDAAQLSVGYLSQLERDHATPSLGTLAQIARALEVGVDYFIAAPNPTQAHTRAGERPRFSVDGSSIVYERLGAEFPGNTLSSFLMTVPPGYRSETVSHEGEEIIYVLEGELTQWLAGEEMVMRTGDSLHFRGNLPHAWANHTDNPTRLLWTGTLAMLRSTARPNRNGSKDNQSGAKPAATKTNVKPKSKEKQS